MRRAAAAIACALALVGCGEKEEPLGRETREVTIALDFQPNAAHAGVYAARREARIAIRAPSASTDSLKLLTAGRADLAIVDIHDLGLAQERGTDIVGVGAIVQRPLAAVIAEPGVRRPRDLEGRRVGVTGLPSDDAVLRAVVERDRGDFRRVKRVTIGFSAVPSLIAGKVAAATAFWNAEGVTLRERGERTREFRVDRYGAPRYPELVLAVTRETLERDRPLIAQTLAALATGTRAALVDRDRSVEEIAEASGADDGLVRKQLDALAPALEPPLRLDREALEGWARFDVRFGILSKPPDLERSFAFIEFSG